MFDSYIDRLTGQARSITHIPLFTNEYSSITNASHLHMAAVNIAGWVLDLLFVHGIRTDFHCLGFLTLESPAAFHQTSLDVGV